MVGRLHPLDLSLDFDDRAYKLGDIIDSRGDLVTSRIHTLSGIVRTMRCLSVGSAR